VNEARPYVDRSAAPEQEGAIKRADVSHSASDDPESEVGNLKLGRWRTN
jgi:hypothetical protein